MNLLQAKIQNSSSYQWWVLAVVMLGTFMAVLDVTVVNVAIPAIMDSFEVRITTAEWVVTAYMITLTIMLATSGWIADRFGNKRVYVMGIALFTFASWLCGRADSDDLLIIARSLQGAGAGVIQALGLAIVSREFTPRQRGVALGFWAAAAAASISFGPLIGGYLVDRDSWHMIFDVNVPIGIFTIIAAWLIQKEWRNGDIGRFDWVGFVSISIFLIGIIFGLTKSNSATNPLGWGAPEVVIPLIAAAISAVIFVMVELRSDHPLLDLKLLKDRTFGVSMLVLFMFSIGMFGVVFLLPLYMQNGLGYTALMAGAVFLPVGIIQGVMAPLSGFIARRIGFMPLIVTGITCMVVSLAVASGFDTETPKHTLMLALYFRGLGMGLTFAPLSTMALTHISTLSMSSASGIANTIKQLSGSISIALLTAVMTSRIAYHESLQHPAMIDRATSHSEVVVDRVAYAEGVADAFRLTVGITALGGLALILLYKRRDKGQGTETPR